jgi:hypothetical protein
MIERLIRIGVALAVAFVFTGRMEAAAAHCARLAVEKQAVIEPQNDTQHDATPCHGMSEAAAPEHGSRHPAEHHPAQNKPAQNQCECIAVLAGFTSFAPSVTSAHMAPYEWLRPKATAFASVEPSPGLRPPNV